MVDILIRNVEPRVAARLQVLAEERGTSVQQVARDILAQGAAIGRADLVARMKARAARMPPQTSNSVDIIRAIRDGEERP